MAIVAVGATAGRAFTLAIAGLVVGGFALVLALAALIRARGTRPAFSVAVVVGAALLVLTAFAISEPIVWRAAFGESPPEANVTDLSSLIAVVVTILSLLAATIGVLLFSILKSRGDELLNKAEAKAKVDVRFAYQRAAAFAATNAG